MTTSLKAVPNTTERHRSVDEDPGNAELPARTTAAIQKCIALVDTAVLKSRNRRLAPREIEMVVGAVIDWIALHKPRALDMRG